MLLGKLGKMYGVSPAYFYLGITEPWLCTAVDLACAVAVWEDENYNYEKSKETAGAESAAIGSVIDRYKKQLESR